MRFVLFISILVFNHSYSQTNCPSISTYFGQVQFDEFKSVCTDTKGNIYAIGNTYNANLPITTGAFQPLYKANYESFLVKFDSCGTLIWCTYFGTQGFDSGEKIAYSNDSSIVFTGYTDGNDIDTTFNCFQPASKGNYECYLAKFNLNGQAKWVTYFGGANTDLAYSLTVDKSNNIIMGGATLSSTLYTNSQSFQPAISGATDAFISKFDKNGVLKFCTYYGGNSSEDIHSLTTDGNKNIIATGASFSSNLNTSAQCLQTTTNGGMEIYVIKLDSIGNRIFSTYIGGSGTDDAYGVCSDNFKNIYVTGHTNSNNFYFTAVSHQTVIAGSNDNFCIKLTPTGTLLWSTVFGGSSFDYNVDCKLNYNDEIISLISTQSADFPMLGTNNYSVHTGSSDVALALINSNGQLKWCSFKGGSGSESPVGLFINKNKALICGSTASANFPVNNGNYQVSNNGQDDGFLTTIFFSFSALSVPEQIGKTNCAFSYTQEFENLRVEILCDEISRLLIFDLFGREVKSCERPSASNNFILHGLNPFEMYILTGVNSQGTLLLRKKLLPR